MSKYLNIDGNYKVSVTDTGTITLDTGSGVGTVIITGDLQVNGETTTVNTSQLTIEDRIITLNNNGASGGQISPDGGQQVAGIEIDRGASDVYWVFDENIGTEADGPGAWVGRAGSSGASGQIVGIRTTSIDTAGTDLFLINQGTGVVTVSGTSDYEKRIFEYDGSLVDFTQTPVLKADQHDTLVNAKGMVDYLDGFFVGRFQRKIEGPPTTLTKSYVEVKDNEDTFFDDEFGVTTLVEGSLVEIGVDGNAVAEFYTNRVELQHLRITDTTITTTSSNADLVLAAPGVGSVRVDDSLLLTPGPHADDDGTGGAIANYGLDSDTENPDPPDEGVKIYAKSEGPAGSGVYFVNSNETQDEMVSKL